MKSFNAKEFFLGDLRRTWLCIFVYATLTALLLQCVILPQLVPGLHAGNGLIAGGDWVGFHRFAKELAEKISLQGWSVWELRYERQAPVGIAAAIYVFAGPHPWALVPLSAAVHATTAILIILMVVRSVPNLRYSVVCVLPFIVLPSSLIWYGQIHKDGFFFLGICLCLYGWILLSRTGLSHKFLADTSGAVFCIFAGCFFVWLMRPYGIKLMQGAGVFLALVLLPTFGMRAMRRRISSPHAVLAALIVVILPIAMGIYKDRTSTGEVGLVTNTMMEPTTDEEEKAGGIEKIRGSFASKVQNVVSVLQWQKTTWLPDAIDNGFLTLSVVRFGYGGSKGGSNIDDDVMFRDVSAFARYLPRAIQIGFAAPFPTSWFGLSSPKSSLAVRAISVVETMVMYASLPFMVYFLWKRRKNIELWLIFSFCTAFILLYTYITPNVGSLHRSRHGFLMILVGLGIAGTITLVKRNRDNAGVLSINPAD